ncbi:hypothetical protein Pelo_17543 [Pelomyxa schiedti]|nr:hypothetical protein Pelo_17543 [Pelomyxa schiedti]
MSGTTWYDATSDTASYAAKWVWNELATRSLVLLLSENEIGNDELTLVTTLKVRAWLASAGNDRFSAGNIRFCPG